MTHLKYMQHVEAVGQRSDLHKLYLWPAVDMWKLTSKEIQSYIFQRVGATDYEVENPISRPYLLIKQIRELVETEVIPESFSLLDITFGDGINLLQIQKVFPTANCFGIDCCTDAIDTHAEVREAGISLHKGFIQHLFREQTETPFDVVIMLNTYRGWESAKLRDDEKDLPQLADHWFAKNASYLILTVTPLQMKRFKKRGYHITYMGKGEDASSLICLSKKPRKTFLPRLEKIASDVWQKICPPNKKTC